MLSCAFALSLLAIVAGMMLLAHTRKDSLGNMFKYVSWFVIVCGFLSILGICAQGAMKCCPMMREHRMMMREGRMMDGGMDGYGMMRGHRGMMGHMGGGGCGMMNNDCCGGMEGGCNEGMMGGHEDMSECHEGMGECNERKDGGSCPMMKGEMMEKKDTIVKKK